jgi:hypothetical protein
MTEQMRDPRSHRLSRRGSKAIVIALAVGLASVGAAGAASGVLPVGTVIPGGSDPEDRFEHRLEDKTIVARGTSPVAGPWRLTSMRHHGNPETGEAPGDCLELLLTEPPEGTPIGATMLCQTLGKARFKADSVPVVDTSTGESEALVFGSAPEGVASVALSTDRGERERAETTEAPRNFGAGRPWVVVVPSDQNTARLQAIGGDGSARGELDATTYLEQLAIWERALGD